MKVIQATISDEINRNVEELIKIGFDCKSFIIMKELGLEDVLTGDRHFANAGLRMHP